MFGLKDKSVCNEHCYNNNRLTILELKEEEFDNLVLALVNELPNYFVDPVSIAGTLERLGKKAAAEKLMTKLPERNKIRSGDIGEILATDCIEETTEFIVPVRKLRWRDHRNMAMRGDDVIGILVNKESQTIRFLKAEAKSAKGLSRELFQKAQEELDLNDGLPAPHALEFIAERLRETGSHEISDLIEKVQLIDTINASQVEHLLFTFTESNPSTLQKEAIEAYSGNIRQRSIGFRVKKHPELISSVFKGVIDGLNN